MLNMYSKDANVHMPNMDRLCRRGVIFDNHFCGSAPCMPARRDILTGRLNFLEKPWGAMEPFDFSMPEILKEKNVHSQMFSDHAHYVIPGGENYTKGFAGWDVYRGQEGDPWRTNRPEKNGLRKTVPPAGLKGVYSEEERFNRESFRTEYDYPSVKTLYNASRWLEENHNADNFLLWVECFDPHEPYDAPMHYLRLYESEEDYGGLDFTHPDYQPNIFSEAETRHLKNRCKALMTMTDRHLGEIFDVLDAHNMWEDTLVILTTDHGFHLGEHGYMAKNYMPPYNEVFHIPLIVCCPGVAPGRRDTLTQNIDILPTLMELYGIAPSSIPYSLHGRSLLPALRNPSHCVHSEILYGYFGKQVAYRDAAYTYFRSTPDEANRPLYVYTAMPTVLRQYFGANDGVQVLNYDRIEMGRFLPWTEYPVYRFPADIILFKNPSQEFMKRSPYNEQTMLFDNSLDPAQEQPLDDPALERVYMCRLRALMEQCQAPEEQYQRLGL